MTILWRARAGAFALDVFFGMGVLATIVVVAWAAPMRSWQWWLCMGSAGVVFLVMAANRWLLPAVVGTSAGRALFGITVSDRDGGVVSPWRLLLRDVAHVLDTAALGSGWLWPLWDSQGRTFADILTRTRVQQLPSVHHQFSRWIGLAVAAGAVSALVIATVGYVTVYRHELAINQVRHNIAHQGPEIVEEVLSYSPATLEEDFSYAQSLVTDEYRHTLLPQQDSVRSSSPVDNDYWVTNSAVLTAGTDRAAMMMLLQGQRGVAPEQRLITATVRVEFEKSATGQWQLDELSVLTKPDSPQD